MHLHFTRKTRVVTRVKPTLAGPDVLDVKVASGAAVGLGQRAEAAVRASVEGADWSVPRRRDVRRHRRRSGTALLLLLCRVAFPGRAAAAAADTVQQNATVGGTDATWLTVPHSTHLVGAGTAAPESVARIYQRTATVGVQLERKTNMMTQLISLELPRYTNKQTEPTAMPSLHSVGIRR